MYRHWYDYSGNLAYYVLDGFDLYITANAGQDSVIYVKDSVGQRLRRERTRKENELWGSNAYKRYNNLEAAVDSSATVKRKKNGKLVTVPGRAKVTVSYYEPVELEQLGWINCDRFYNYPDGVAPEYTIDIKGTVPPEIGVYVICKNINGVMSNKIFTNGQSKKNILQQLPLNSEVEFLVYSKIGKQFLQSKYTARVTNGMVIPVDLKPVPDGQVKKMFLN
jgi:hypothetical protein